MKLPITCILTLLFMVTACAGPAPEAHSLTANGASSTQAALTGPLQTVVPSLSNSTVLSGGAAPDVSVWYMSPLTLNPGTIRAGSPVEIWTSVYQPDYNILFVVARLEVNGVVVDQARWSLYLDESDPHCFVYTPGAPGTYDIRIIACLEDNDGYNRMGGEQMGITRAATLHVT